MLFYNFWLLICFSKLQFIEHEHAEQSRQTHSCTTSMPRNMPILYSALWKIYNNIAWLICNTSKWEEYALIFCHEYDPSEFGTSNLISSKPWILLSIVQKISAAMRPKGSDLMRADNILPNFDIRMLESRRTKILCQHISVWGMLCLIPEYCGQAWDVWAFTTMWGTWEIILDHGDWMIIY